MRPTPRGLAALGILLLPFAAALWRLPYGLDLTDEGFALSVPLRVAYGDLPVRDETMTAYRMFEVVLWPLFRLHPEIRVIELRALGLALRFALIGSWVLLLRRYADPLTVAVAAAAVAVPFLTYWEPGYDLLGTHLALLGVSLALHACGRRRPAVRDGLRAAGGVLLGLGTVAYLPVAAVGLASLGVLAASGLRGSLRPWRRPAAWFCGGFAGLMGLGAVLYTAAGLWDDLAYVRGTMAHLGEYNEPARMLVKLVRQSATVLRHGAAATLVLVFLTKLLPGAPGWRAALALAVAALLPLQLTAWMDALAIGPLGQPVTALRSYGPGLPILALTCGFHLAALYLGLGRRADPDPQWRRVWGVTLLLTAAALAAIGFAASSGVRKWVYGVGPAFVLGAIALLRAWRTLEADGTLSPAQRRFAHVWLVLLLAVGGVAVNARMLGSVHRDAALSELTMPFTHPALRGIYSSPERVEQIELALDHLDGRLAPGDFFLAYDELPIFYFLTRTRPALNYAWARASRYPHAIQEDSLRTMVERGRVPRYVLRATRVRGAPARLPGDIDRSDNPIDAFVRAYYRRVRVIPGRHPLEIYRLEPAAAERFGLDPEP